MGIVDKLMFWKKEDDFSDLGLGDPFSDKPSSMDTGLRPDPMDDDSSAVSHPSPNAPSSSNSYGMDSQPSGQSMAGYPPNAHSSPAQPAQHEPSNDMVILAKNIEVVSSKIDALRASVDSLSQRVANIERIAMGEEDKRRGW